MFSTNELKMNLEKYVNENEKLKFFRIFLWYIYSDLYNWKFLAHSIYHIEHLIKKLNNYQIKEFIEKQFENLLNYFILFIKHLITIQTKSQSLNINDTPNNSIEEHIENLKHHLTILKELILTARERFNHCKIDIDDTEILLKAIENINFDKKTFDKHDENKIDLLSLEQNLSKKSNKTDLIQMKIYIDNQIKKLIEINKQNAKELEQIRLFKTSTCYARHIQTILSTKNSPPKTNRTYSYQTSRPYITFELNHIRQYQRQALVQSPYGIIPLYRREAWAAANLLPNQSLNYIRYIQNSLRTQIDDLLGCRSSTNRNIIKKSNIEIYNKNQDILIVGNNNKFYRGQIESCEIIPRKKFQKKQIKKKKNFDENNETNQIHFEEFNQINKTILDEHLFEYLDWDISFNEQDLPDELCEELFHHWSSIICDDQPCICKIDSKIILENKIEIDSLYDERCICSECSCNCEKYENEKSICLCSQCSCKCLKDNLNENEDNIENISQTNSI